jgi:hypothetical protein
MKMAPTPINDKNKIIFIIENEDEDDNFNDSQEIRCDYENSQIEDEKSYYSRNKEIFQKRYMDNLENRRAYQNDYNLINHERYSEYQRSYYEQRREKLLESKKERIMCECGKMVSAGHMTCHKKSNIHIKRMNAKLIST